MRAIKAMTIQVGLLVRSGVDPTDATFTALHCNYKSLLTEEDVPIFQEIVNANFPNANVVCTTGDFAQKFASSNPDASAFAKEKGE